LNSLKNINNISELNSYLGIEPSKHSGLDIQSYVKGKSEKLVESPPICINFYVIAYKRYKNMNLKKFGQTDGDPDNGFIYFLKPGDVYEWSDEGEWEGFHIAIHEEFLKEYNNFIFNFFSYSTKEALFLTTDEEKEVKLMFTQGYTEFLKKDSSLKIILSYCNVLLALVEKYYKRQFTSRKTTYNRVVQDFQSLLNEYMNVNQKQNNLPTVTELADKLHVTPNYLSDLLKEFTGKTAIELIHIQTIYLAKDKLRNSSLSVSEIAFSLGFEYPTYFSRLFKQQTGKSPSQYRNQ